MTPDHGNGWDVWGKHILEELKRINDSMDKLNLRMSCIEREVTGLQVKSGMWGALGGIATVGVVLLITMKG